MILIECSVNGYELIAESSSREYLENLQKTGAAFSEEIEEHAMPISTDGNIYSDFQEEVSFKDPNVFEEESQLLIVPRSVIGRKGDLSIIEALQEKFPLPSMLKQRLSELSQF